LWVIELFDSLSGHRLDDNGIRPLETDGLMGSSSRRLLHSNWQHLMANTVPALILWLPDDTGRPMSRFIFATRDHLDSRRLRHLADRQRRGAGLRRGSRREPTTSAPRA